MFNTCTKKWFSMKTFKANIKRDQIEPYKLLRFKNKHLGGILAISPWRTFERLSTTSTHGTPDWNQTHVTLVGGSLSRVLTLPLTDYTQALSMRFWNSRKASGHVEPWFSLSVIMASKFNSHHWGNTSTLRLFNSRMLEIWNSISKL